MLFWVVKTWGKKLKGDLSVGSLHRIILGLEFLLLLRLTLWCSLCLNFSLTLINLMFSLFSCLAYYCSYFLKQDLEHGIFGTEDLCALKMMYRGCVCVKEGDGEKKWLD